MEETESFVDWEVTGKAVSHTPHFTTMLKFVFDLLPVGNRVHKYDPKYSPQCPSCDEPKQTQKKPTPLAPLPLREQIQMETSLPTTVPDQSPSEADRPSDPGHSPRWTELLLRARS